MRLVMIFAVLASSACFASSSRPPVPASHPTKQFDPFAEVIEVPDDTCHQLNGWYCMTERAWKEIIKADIEQERVYSAKLAHAETSTRIAETQRQAAMSALERAQWWSNWGPFIAAGSALIAGGLGIGLGFGLRK